MRVQPCCEVCRGTRLNPVSGEPGYLACLECGLVHHLRSPDRLSEESRYLSEGYSSSPARARRQFAWMERVLRTRGGVEPTLLDVGCGSGQFLAEAASRGWQVTGWEINAEAASRAQARVGTGRVLCGSASVLPLSGAFGVITLWDVLDHLEDPRTVLTRLAHRLAPAGLLLARVRNAPFHLAWRRLHRLLRRLRGNPSDARLGGVIHRYGFSARSLARLFEQAGLEGSLRRHGLSGASAASRVLEILLGLADLWMPEGASCLPSLLMCGQRARGSA